METKNDPFSYDYAQFSALSNEERNAVIAQEKKQTKQFVQNYFNDNPNIVWLVIAKSPENVILKGGNIFEPMDLNLSGVAQEENAPIFLHFKG